MGDVCAEHFARHSRPAERPPDLYGSGGDGKRALEKINVFRVPRGSAKGQNQSNKRVHKARDGAKFLSRPLG